MVERREMPPNSADSEFYRWAAERYRGRAGRLTWVLLAVVLAAAAIVVVLLLQMNETAKNADAARAQARRANQRLEAVVTDLRAADRRAQRLSSCIDKSVVEVTEGVHSLLAREVSIATYLRRYRPERCS